MGELWPGGPVAPPFDVDVAGLVVTIRERPPLRVAYLIATRQALMPYMLDDADAERLHAAMVSPFTPVDSVDVLRASYLVAARLVGLRREWAGWRAAVRLCATLITDWQTAGALLCGAGADPITWPLWRTCQVLHHTLACDPTRMDEKAMNAAAARLFGFLDDEPDWIDPQPVTVPVSRARQVASAQALFEQLTGTTFAAARTETENRITAMHTDPASSDQPDS